MSIERSAGPVIQYGQMTALLSFPSEGVRNDWLTRQLDPSGQLPVVGVSREVEEPFNCQFEMRVTDAQARRIGGFTLDLPDWRPGEYGTHWAVLDYIELEDEYRGGRGYGRALYLEILRQLPFGMGLMSDVELTPGSLSVWKWLESNKVAEGEGMQTIQEQIDDKHKSIFGWDFRTVF